MVRTLPGSSSLLPMSSGQSAPFPAMQLPWKWMGPRTSSETTLLLLSEAQAPFGFEPGNRQALCVCAPPILSWANRRSTSRWPRAFRNRHDSCDRATSSWKRSGIGIMNRQAMLERAYQRETSWDMVILGGGATGVGVAIDAASRGFDVLLLEAQDF